jgi:two-component system, OmpR family, sensor histidine kinase QseC
MNWRSLRVRSLLTVLAVVLPVLAIYAYLSHAHVSHQLGYRLDGRMKHEVTMLREAVLRSGGDNARLREIVDIMPIDTFPQRRLYGVWADGELILSTQSLPFDTVPTLDPGYSDVEAGNSAWRILVDLVPASAQTQGRNIAVLVADPMAVRTSLIRGGAIDTTLPVLIAVPVLIIGIYIALIRSLGPLTQLAEQIRNRSPARLTPLETTGVPSEVKPIAESVNALLARLAESLEQERRFTADAAHELRTPLTALKAHAQVALRAQDETLRRETLQSIARIVGRTDRMISQLLILARLDPQVSRIQTEQVDLGKLVAQSLSDLQVMAEARGHELQLEAQPAVTVRGSSTALTILVRNVVENALQYSNDGEPVEVKVLRDGAHGILTVSDTGPGIPDVAKQEVFNRFRRLPDAKAPGTGLGLSIVQRIAELHGADVTLQDVESRTGLRVAIRIPAAA